MVTTHCFTHMFKGNKHYRQYWRNSLGNYSIILIHAQPRMLGNRDE